MAGSDVLPSGLRERLEQWVEYSTSFSGAIQLVVSPIMQHAHVLVVKVKYIDLLGLIGVSFGSQ